MKTKLLLVVSLLLVASLRTFATYTAATIIANEPQPDGRTRLVVSFSGNAGEPALVRETFIDSSTTTTSLRAWAIAQRDAMNSVRSLATTPALQVGQTVNLAALPAAPAPTAQELWLNKAFRLQRVKALGVTNSAYSSDLAALQADVDATYQAGFLSGF